MTAETDQTGTMATFLSELGVTVDEVDLDENDNEDDDDEREGKQFVDDAAEESDA